MGSKEEALSPLLSLGGPFKCGFFFLIRLAWDSHTRIPILIAIIFMVCDIRMQLEIDIETAVRRLPRQNNEEDEEDGIVVDNETDSDEGSEEVSIASTENSVEDNSILELNLCGGSTHPMPQSSSSNPRNE